VKKVLIVRHGAYGDIVHTTHLPRLLKDNGFDYVGYSTGWKGRQVLEGNPLIDKLHYMEFGGKDITKHFYDTRIKLIGEEYDKVIELTHSIELAVLAFENQNKYYLDQEEREKGAWQNYYDVTTIQAGYPELCGKYKGELFFKEAETKMVEYDLLRPGRFKDKFKVMFNLAGSCPHKILVIAKDLGKMVLDKYPEAHIFTTGDGRAKEIDLAYDPRVHSVVAKKPFRQVLHMAKYMDCVVGHESGIMCGASCIDVPSIHLMTAAAIVNHCKYAKNDYSLQSPAKCSPCFKGPYDYYGCPKRDNLPICINFNVKTVFKQIEKIYKKWNQQTQD
jgi:ADP-heptose:LPS heptosyltransferase